MPPEVAGQEPVAGASSSYATTMQSWANLKASMESIGDQVLQIMLVQKDIGAMQQDLAAQERLWQEAERQLKAENDKLRQEISLLGKEVLMGEPIQNEVAALRKRLEDEKRHNTELEAQFKSDKAKWDDQRSFLEKQKSELKSKIKTNTDESFNEARRASEQLLQLQRDAVGLRLRIAELQAELKQDNQDLLVAQQAEANKVAALKVQLQQMQEGLARLKEQQALKGRFEQELAQLQTELDQETTELLRLQALRNQAAIQCSRAYQYRQQVFMTEQGKVATRHAESVQLCQPVNSQNSVLQQWIQECEVQTQTGNAQTHNTPPLEPMYVPTPLPYRIALLSKARQSSASD